MTIVETKIRNGHKSRIETILYARIETKLKTRLKNRQKTLVKTITKAYNWPRDYTKNLIRHKTRD